MKKEDIDQLLDRRMANRSSETDNVFLESWYNSQKSTTTETYTLEERLEDSMLVWNTLTKHEKTKPIKLWSRLAIAASVVIAMGFASYYLLTRPTAVADISFASTIQPGGNKAYLILADGKKITLGEALVGKLAEQAGITITKTKDGMLKYEVQNTENLGAGGYNTITTPNGGKYQINLPDGTEVWLNAASSLKFPVSFATLEKRSVELTGEAYFEVAKDKAHPFEVKTALQTVEVLGTHFNINSYSDEPHSKTTLLEGSVKINPITAQQEVVIKPGEQATNSESGIKVAKVDAENVIDWKNDEFYFKDMDFKTAMRKIARWYDIEVIYEPGVFTDFEPGGWISRKSSIKSVLKMMELTGKVHFKAEGRRITIIK
jgi:transmembrane sensor